MKQTTIAQAMDRTRCDYSKTVVRKGFITQHSIAYGSVTYFHAATTPLNAKYVKCICILLTTF